MEINGRNYWIEPVALTPDKSYAKQSLLRKLSYNWQWVKVSNYSDIWIGDLVSFEGVEYIVRKCVSQSDEFGGLTVEFIEHTDEADHKILTIYFDNRGNIGEGIILHVTRPAYK